MSFAKRKIITFQIKRSLRHPRPSPPPLVIHYQLDVSVFSTASLFFANLTTAGSSSTPGASSGTQKPPRGDAGERRGGSRQLPALGQGPSTAGSMADVCLQQLPNPQTTDGQTDAFEACCSKVVI